jgi:hypothetical protein
MATINGSTNTSVWSFKLEVVENSTSVANNSSKVTVTAYIGRPSSAGASYLYGASISCPVSVTGVTAKTISYSNSGQVNVAAGGWVSIGSVVFDSVPHNADGTKTVTVSATFTSNISPASGSASGSVKLTNIARASTFTIDKTTIYANGSDKITVTINAKNTAYKHTVLVAFGSTYSQTFNVAAGVTTQSFTIPYEWLNGIPAQMSSNSTNIILSTYNGETLVGTASLPKGFTITCPDNVNPVITSVTQTGNNLRDGVYVQGKSTATIKTVAGGSYGSKIVSYSCTVDGTKYTSSEFTTLAFKTAGSYTVTVTVTDGRGKTASKSLTAFTVYEYKQPYITSFTAARQSDGTSVVATLVGGVSSLNSKNGKAFSVTLNGTTKTITSTGFTVNGSVTFTGVDTDKTFTAIAKVADYYTEATMPVVVPTEAVTMDFLHDGKGVAIGKVSEETGLFDVAWPMKSPSVDNLCGGYGTLISSGTNLNTPAYLKVGTYVCNSNATATSLTNCPTSSAFKMTVTNVIYKNPTPSADASWYLVREIMNLYGYKYYQYVHTNGNGGWSYGTWFVRLDGFWVKDYVIEQGTYSDGWEYAKWNNGRIELWLDKSLSFPAATQQTTYLWRSIVSIDLSSKLKKIIGGSCSVQYSGVVPQLCRHSTTLTTAEIVIVTSRPMDAFTTTVPIHIIGKWK